MIDKLPQPPESDEDAVYSVSLQIGRARDQASNLVNVRHRSCGKRDVWLRQIVRISGDGGHDTAMHGYGEAHDRGDNNKTSRQGFFRLRHR